jgi:hypothetical protein
MPALWATVALVTLLAIPPLSKARALAIWIVLVAGLALLTLIRGSRRGAWPDPPRRFEQALRGRKPAAPQTAEFLRMERQLDLGVASAGEAHVAARDRARAPARSRPRPAR